MKCLKRLLKWSARLQVVAGFQYYTIRNLDNKLSTQSDIEQYKLLSIKEDPLDNRQNISMSCAFRYYFLMEILESIIHAK